MTGEYFQLFWMNASNLNFKSDLRDTIEANIVSNEFANYFNGSSVVMNDQLSQGSVPIKDVGSSEDMNNFKTGGVYSVHPNATNNPIPGTSMIVEVYEGNFNVIIQNCRNVEATEHQFLTRKYNKVTDIWGSWYKLDMTLLP